MYMTLREPYTKRIHVAAAQPGHTLCGVVFDVNSRPVSVPLIGVAYSLDDVVHLENICPKCKEVVNPKDVS